MQREMVSSSSSSTTTATISLKTTTAMTVKSLNCRLIDYISISTDMFVSITENMLAFAYAEQRWLGDFVLLLHFSSCVCTGSGSSARAYRLHSFHIAMWRWLDNSCHSMESSISHLSQVNCSKLKSIFHWHELSSATICATPHHAASYDFEMRF